MASAVGAITGWVRPAWHYRSLPRQGQSALIVTSTFEYLGRLGAAALYPRHSKSAGARTSASTTALRHCGRIRGRGSDLGRGWAFCSRFWRAPNWASDRSRHSRSLPALERAENRCFTLGPALVELARDGQIRSCCVPDVYRDLDVSGARAWYLVSAQRRERADQMTTMFGCQVRILVAASAFR
jgi:hypothetical protein